MTEQDADQAEPVEGVSRADDAAEILRENARGASIRPVEFAQAAPQAPGPSSNIDLLLDVPLELTVELGRTTMNVRSILALGSGAVIELQKLAGEPVDILINNRPIATGEVVVVDDNFGVRIADILDPKKRIETLR